MEEHNKYTVLSKFHPRPFTEELLREYDFRCEGAKGYLWRYNPERGIWTANGEDFIRHYFRRMTDSIDDTLKKKNVIEEIIADVQGYTYQEEGLTDPPITLIPLGNGVYDLESDKIRDYTPEDCFTWKLPWDYHPHSCDYLEGLINSMLPQEEVITLWELMAYTLRRGYPYQKFFLLHGGGRNGKSTFMSILTRLLGPENISNVSLGDLQDNRFAGGNLHHKLANVSGEVDYSDLENTKLLKQLTGGDYIEADRKYKNPVKFLNHAKLIFLTNQIPKTKDTTDAFYRRVFLIDFPYQFDVDPSIDVRLRESSPAMNNEYCGLLVKVLQHLRRLKSQGFRFTREQEIDSIREKYDYLSNPIVQFIKEICDRTYNSDDFIYKYEFLEKLNDWLKSKKFNTYSSEKAGKAMKEIGLEDSKKDSPNKERRYYAWVGMRWKPKPLVNDSVQDVHLSYADTNKDIRAIEKVSTSPDNVDKPDSKCSNCPEQPDCNSINMTPSMRELCEKGAWT